MNAYDPDMALTAATALARFMLWWFEDICDPLDFDTHARIAARYDPPIAAGEALFSAAEAVLLDRYAGLRPGRDILLFDPVHCYGLPGYGDHQQVHGRRLVTARVPAPRQLVVRPTPRGGAGPRRCRDQSAGLPSVPRSAAALPVTVGRIPLPDVPGIGFELHDEAWQAFRSLGTPPG